MAPLTHLRGSDGSGSGWDISSTWVFLASGKDMFSIGSMVISALGCLHDTTLLNVTSIPDKAVDNLRSCHDPRYTRDCTHLIVLVIGKLRQPSRVTKHDCFLCFSCCFCFLFFQCLFHFSFAFVGYISRFFSVCFAFCFSFDFWFFLLSIFVLIFVFYFFPFFHLLSFVLCLHF